MKIVWLFTKILIAVVILWSIWDKFDWQQIEMVVLFPWLLLVILLGWLLNLVFTTLRLYSLFKAMGRKIWLMDVVQAAMSSLFIGNLVPGVAGSDIAKFFYLKRHDPLIPNTWLVMTITLDRILGLVSILFWCSLFSFFIDTSVYEDETLSLLIYLPLIIFVAFIIGSIILTITFKYSKRFNLPSMIKNFIEAYTTLFNKGNSRQITLLSIYNLAAVFLLIGSLVFVGAFLNVQQNEPQMIILQFFLIPLVLIVAMLPLTPLGIGTAQLTLAGAYTLFGLDPSVGISVSTLSQVGQILISCTIGGGFFFLSKKKLRVRD